MLNNEVIDDRFWYHFLKFEPMIFKVCHLTLYISGRSRGGTQRVRVFSFGQLKMPQF